jgi:sulfite reductase (NADPH) flavoprotein alpha-component
MLKQVLFQAHWLIGITAGIVLAVVGVTGGMLSFETGILNWLNSDVRSVAPRPESVLPPAELVERIKAAHPEKTLTALSLSSDPQIAAKVTFALPKERESGKNAAPGDMRERTRGAAERANGSESRGRQGPPGRGPRGEVRYVNPYSGALIEGKGNVGESFFQGTRSLHRWLTAGDFGNRDVGKQIVDASTVLLVLLALSGLYLRWPRSAGNWRSWLKLDFALKGRSFLWHLHAVLGTWLLALYLVMSLTGLYFGYEWYRDGLYSLTGTPRPERREMGGMRGAGERSREAADLTVAWATFKQSIGEEGFSVANLDLSHGKRVEIRYLAAQAPHERAFNTIEIDSSSGAVIKSERYAAKPAGAKFLASMFPLHAGSFFGVPGTVLFMIASLAMPVFAITGWMLYLDRRKKKYAARATARDLAALKPNTSSETPGDLLIGFASQAGFARQLAWQTAGSLQSAGVNVQVHSLAKLGAEQLSKFKRALFVVSTFGEGEPPDDARGFARRMMQGSMPLPNMKFGLLALGDRQYQTFCAFGEALEGWLRKQGAEPLFPRVEVDCGHPEALVEWQERLGEITGRSLSAWVEPQFERWRLADRRLLNEGSVGAPMYHIELEPSDPKLLNWEAGDIAEILAPVIPAGVETPERPPLPDARREFSIASIPQDGRVHLTVRQLRCNDGSLGVGSGWLTHHAPVGAFVKLRVRSNPSFHAPSADSPLILIGNGSGIAGLRGHLKARQQANSKGVWLIFGERNEQYDYLYRREIESWRGTGMVERLDLAFSRDQSERLYVQHVITARAETVREWMGRNAVILVCGSLEGMAPGVDSALRQVLGEPEVQRLAAEGRYRRDVY